MHADVKSGNDRFSIEARELPRIDNCSKKELRQRVKPGFRSGGRGTKRKFFNLFPEFFT